MLDQFAPSVSLLEKLRDAPVMADTTGEAMSSEDAQAWEQKAQFNQNRGAAADGYDWASASQVSMDQTASEIQAMEESQEESQAR